MPNRWWTVRSWRRGYSPRVCKIWGDGAADRRRDPGARLNILAANGNELVATTWGDTLSILEAADGVVVASEPYDDDPSWVDIPDRRLVRVRDGKVEIEGL